MMGLLATLSWVFVVYSIGGCAQVTEPGGVPVDITITAWPGAAVPLEGVELCETATVNCSYTDADGKARLWLPAGETSFTKEKEGFVSYLVPLFVPANGLAHESRMGTDAFVETLYEDVMSPYPIEDEGRISTGVSPAFAGVTLALFDADGPIADPKAYYVVGGPPPTWSVQFGGTAINCIAVPTGWPGLFLQNSIRLPVRAGFITQAIATCEQAP
jgi:hypothetical protein